MFVSLSISSGHRKPSKSFKGYGIFQKVEKQSGPMQYYFFSYTTMQY
jgi:hypothetical protein